MRLRLITQAILVAVLLAPLGVVVVAAPAGAAGPMITVTPNSGLTDGQVVTVAADGIHFPSAESGRDRGMYVRTSGTGWFYV